jgi:thiol:disulfide interchange protein DsbA
MIKRLIVIIVLTVFSIGGTANGAALEEDARIEVVEFFQYGCPHCFDVEQALSRWLEANSNVRFSRVPLVIGRDLKAFPWWRYAKTYFVFEKMNVLESMHTKFYEAIHIEKRDFPSKEEISEFVLENGLDSRQFEIYFDSEEILRRAEEARDYRLEHEIDETPTFIVNNTYRMTLPMSDFDMSALFNNIDEYIAGLD